jgi:transcriptional regulator with XRE-family HTH domain
MKGRALVAWNLRRIRVRRGLSQERLAFDAGVDRSYVGGLERREENPTVDVLDRLAKTLAVHVSEFFVEPAKGATPPEPLKRGRRPALQPRAKSRGRVGGERLHPGEKSNAFA